MNARSDERREAEPLDVRIERLRARLSVDRVEMWIPGPGDVLLGRLVEVEWRENRIGEYPVLTVERPDGTWVEWHAGFVVARRHLRRLDPGIGDLIGVKYLSAPSEDRPFHDCLIEVEREPGSIPVCWTAAEGDLR